GMIEQINAVATHGLHPDLTALLDLPVDVGLARATGMRQADRFERQDPDFHERVRQGYLELAEQEAGRWVVVDGELPPEQVTALIWQRLAPLLERPR
ncbi:MAG: dTMP kinase, partial [Dehalococcoidia bacterium]